MAKSGEFLTGIVWWSGLSQWQTVFFDRANTGWPPVKAIWTSWVISNNGTTTSNFHSVLSIAGTSIQGTSKQLTPGAGFFSEMPSFSLAAGSYDAELKLYIDGAVYQTVPISIICGQFIYPTFLVEGEGEIYPELGPYFEGQSLLIRAEPEPIGLWYFDYYKRNGVKYDVSSTYTFSNLRSGEVFTAVFAEPHVGSWNTRIVNFKVSPIKSPYAPMDSVIFSGTLQTDELGGWRNAPAGAPIKLYCDSLEVATTITDNYGKFAMAITLPSLEGDYIFKAYYPGQTIVHKSCYSSSITITVSTGDGGWYTCPYCGEIFLTQDELNAHIQSAHPSDDGIPWMKVAIYGGIGLVVLAVIIAAKGGKK